MTTKKRRTKVARKNQHCTMLSDEEDSRFVALVDEQGRSKAEVIRQLIVDYTRESEGV